MKIALIVVGFYVLSLIVLELRLFINIRKAKKAKDSYDLLVQIKKSGVGFVAKKEDAPPTKEEEEKFRKDLQTIIDIEKLKYDLSSLRASDSITILSFLTFGLRKRKDSTTSVKIKM